VNSAKTYLILALALTTIGGVVLGWRQYTELVELRAAAMNSNERAELQKKIWDLQKTNRELQDRLAALRAEHPDGEEAAAAAEDRPRGGAPEPQRPGPPNGRGPTGQQLALRELMAKPEVQAMITSEQKALLDYRYGALFRNLNLPPDQLEKLKTLLIDRQNVVQDVYAAASDQGIDPRQDRDTFNKMVSDARNSVNDTIKSVLGEAGYNQLTTYDQTMPQRNLVSVLQQRLSYSDPLSPSQADQLVQVLASNPSPNSGDGARRSVDLGGGFAGRFAGGVGPSINAVVGPGAVTITPGAVNQAQAVLTPTQLTALQQLQQQQQTANQLEQMRRDALQKANANNPPGSNGTSGGRRGGGG
jgi:hypothetical protein